MPTPAFIREQFLLSFEEQDPTAEISTPAAAPTRWVGKVRTVTGWGQRNKLDLMYFAGNGRLPFEAADLGVDIEGITLAFEVQNAALLALAFGHVEDVGSGPTNATTLSVAAAPGATSVTVASGTGYAIGDYVQIGSGAQKPEIRQASNVVTNVISFLKPLRRAHAIGDAVTEVVAPFTHTLKVGDVFPPPFTLQGVFRGGFSNELAWQIAGCHVIDLTLGHDERDLLVATMTLAASKIVNVTPPATLPTKITTKSFRYADSAFTYFGAGLLGVQAHNVRLGNGGGMEFWSRNPNGEFAAEYVPGRATMEQEVNVIVRDGTLSAQLLARSAAGVAGDVLYTRAASDTLQLKFNGGGVVHEAPHDVPDEGKVVSALRYAPFDYQVVVVDGTGNY